MLEVGKLPAIEKEPENADNTLKLMSRLGKIDAPLIRRYFMENSLIKIMKKLKDHKKILKTSNV